MLVFWIYTCAAWISINTVEWDSAKTKNYGTSSSDCAGNACSKDWSGTAPNADAVKTQIVTDFADYLVNQEGCQRYMAKATIQAESQTNSGKTITEGSYIDPATIDNFLEPDTGSPSVDDKKKAEITLFWTASIPWEFELVLRNGESPVTETGHTYDASKGEKITDILTTIANYLANTNSPPSTKDWGSTVLNPADRLQAGSTGVVCKMYEKNGDMTKKNTVIGALTETATVPGVDDNIETKFFTNVNADPFKIKCFNADTWNALPSA